MHFVVREVRRKIDLLTRGDDGFLKTLIFKVELVEMPVVTCADTIY